MVHITSPAGTSDVYPGGALFNAAGGKGDITAYASSVGESMAGNFILSFSPWDGEDFEEVNLDTTQEYRAEFKYNIERGEDG